MPTEKVELLMLAAKAVGLQFIEPAEGYSGDNGIQVGSDNPMRCYRWNPLDDDGDALRLAVELGLCVTVFLGMHDTMVGYTKGGNEGGNIIVPHEDNCFTATRLAIVLAAAEIGRNQVK